MSPEAMVLYHRLNRLGQEVRAGRGPLFAETPPAGMVSRDAVATRIFEEVAEWLEWLEGNNLPKGEKGNE
jgi:hypothetical protein